MNEMRPSARAGSTPVQYRTLTCTRTIGPPPMSVRGTPNSSVRRLRSCLHASQRRRSEDVGGPLEGLADGPALEADRLERLDVHDVAPVEDERGLLHRVVDPLEVELLEGI